MEQSAIMFKSSIFFFHKFFTSVTRYFLVYLFAQGVNTHAYIKLYALFNRVRLKKKTHTSHFSRQLLCLRTTTTTTTTTTIMFFSLAFLMVAGLATIMHGDCVTEIVGSCQDLEATLTIKYLLFSFTSLYSLVGVTRGCKGQSSTYFISIILVDGRIGKSVAVSLRL